MQMSLHNSLPFYNKRSFDNVNSVVLPQKNHIYFDHRGFFGKLLQIDSQNESLLFFAFRTMVYEDVFDTNNSLSNSFMKILKVQKSYQC